MQAMIVEINSENFQEMVLQNSMHLPILVDFWALWCDSCKQITPLLEKLAQEWSGRFILAKVNTEQQKALVEQFHIKSIPHFKLFHQGKVVQEWQSAQPINEFKAALEAYLKPDASEDFRQQAKQAFLNSEYDRSVSLLGQAAQANPNNYKVHLDLVQMYLHTGHMNQAKDLFTKLPEEAQHSPEGKTLNGLMQFSQIVEEAGNLEQIQQTLADDPNNAEALYGLSGYLMLNQQPEPAIRSLLKLFIADRSFKEGIAQKTLIQIFTLLQDDQPELVKAYRRKLQGLLF